MIEIARTATDIARKQQADILTAPIPGSGTVGASGELGGCHRRLPPATSADSGRTV